MAERHGRRSGDWEQETAILLEEIEAVWPVRVSQHSQHVDLGGRRGLWVVEINAVFTPPLKGFPHTITTMCPVDRNYLTPYQRARYFAAFQLWGALDALDVPPRAPSPSEGP